MSDTAIRCEGLSKRYRIGQRESYKTLRDILTEGLYVPFRRLRAALGSSSARSENNRATIWALKNVSFEVKRGDVVGIIGRNGAGKSTLLKILSRITKPTEGHAEIEGRVGSLLEVGTGFHPELTGRENIYLNGAILGMKKREIDSKFDEIVAFAEVEKFIYTPVKHYSTGMYMRLAFAVAAHLEPEIMLIDEVLAVGDIDFQRKCIGSMRSVGTGGRTVLVVSHNMALIESLCGNAIWLDEGRIKSRGRTQDVIADYLTSARISGSEDLLDHPRRRMNTIARFSTIQILTAAGDHSRDVEMGRGITLRLGIVADQPIRKPWIGIEIRTPFNQLLSCIANREAGYDLPPILGDCVVTCHIEKLNLLPERYFVDLVLADMSNIIYDEVPSAAYFDVMPRDVMGTGMPMAKDYGLLFFATRWELSMEDEKASAII